MTSRLDPARWARLRELFEDTADLEPEAQLAFLDVLQPDDTDLRSALARMWAAEREDADFLDPPARTSLEALPAPVPPEARIGTRIGAFRIERVLATGGMGAVYEALQDEPRRRVALKTMRFGLRSEARRRRFRYEAEILARLRHPGIAQIYDAGVHDGDRPGARATPWFAMELVEHARPLTDYARAEALSFEARVRLFLRIVEAVHHGHLRGVIHRDLKPANLLVDGEGHVKVIDYGVARAADRSIGGGDLTEDGEIVGTLRTMSPEQIAESPADVDARSDVYSLGVVLYELLCERPPHELEGLALAEVTRVLCEEDPVPPTTVRPALPAEIDWIVRRAMEKRAEDRYASVSELGADLHRLLACEPVQAGPPTTRYRLRKLYQRHRLSISVAALAAVVLLLSFAGTVVGLMRVLAAERTANEERLVALDQAEKSQETLDFLLDGLASPDPGRDGPNLRVVTFMKRSAEGIDRRFADRPLVRAWLHQVVGRGFHALGENAQADEHLRLAVDLFRTHDRPGARGVPLALGDLALVCIEDGHFDEAAELIDEAEALLTGPDAERDLGMWRIRAHRGHLLLARGERVKAEEVLAQVLAALLDIVGPRHRDTLRTQSLLGGLNHEEGRLDEAEKYYRPALETSIALLGPEHPDTLRLNNNLAMILHSRGDVEGAVARLEEVLDARRRVLGPEHAETLGARNNLAGIEFLRGNLDRAAALYRESIDVLESAEPKVEDDHPLLQLLLVNLGTVETQRGNYGEAEPLLRRVYAARSRTLGKDNEKTLNAQLELAKLARHTGRPDEAREWIEDGLDRLLGTFGEDHPLLPRFEIEYGRYFLLLGDLDTAEAILLECQEGLRSGERSTARSNPADITPLLEDIAAARQKG